MTLIFPFFLCLCLCLCVGSCPSVSLFSLSLSVLSLSVPVSQRDYERGVQDCDSALCICEGSRRTLYRKALCLRELGRLREAYECGTKCLLTAPHVCYAASTGNTPHLVHFNLFYTGLLAQCFWKEQNVTFHSHVYQSARLRHRSALLSTTSFSPRNGVYFFRLLLVSFVR